MLPPGPTGFPNHAYCSISSPALVVGYGKALSILGVPPPVSYTSLYFLRGKSIDMSLHAIFSHVHTSFNPRHISHRIGKLVHSLFVNTCYGYLGPDMDVFWMLALAALWGRLVLTCAYSTARARIQGISTLGSDMRRGGPRTILPPICQFYVSYVLD